jgi:hypothetical protein
LLFTGFLHPLSGQRGQLLVGDHPAHPLAAEDIQQDVKVIICPFDGSFEFGDIPGPDLVRTCGQKFRS